MSEPIPEDIREKAEAIVRGLCCDSCVFMAGCGCFDRITAVLMEEREICAQIADAEPVMPGEPPEAVLRAMDDAGPAMNARAAASATKRSIAIAIRRGTP